MVGTAAAKSDDSSSSGSDGYSSPSDMDDSDSDDITDRKRAKTDSLMSYRPQKFVKAINNTPSPAIRCGRKKKKNDAIQSRLLLLERKKQMRQQQQQPKRKSSSLDSSDEDSDSDIEDMSKSPLKTAARTGPAFESRRKRPPEEEPKSELIELLESSPEPSPIKEAPTAASAPTMASQRITRAAAAATDATKQAISLLSSDDEDDDDDEIRTLPSQPLNLPPAVAASLRLAQQAKARLEQAQVYQAHDVHVAIEEPVFVPKATTTMRRPQAKATVDMGKTLTVVCRCGHLVIGGTKEALSKDQQSTELKIRQREPLSALIEKFCAAHSLPPQASTIELKFDGEKLDLSKTPTSYEMEDEDLIDVSASAPSRSS